MSVQRLWSNINKRCHFYKVSDGYEDAITTAWCKDNQDVGGRDNCASDEQCLENGRKLCDGDPTCFGITWYKHRLTQPLKLCRSIVMVPKNDGWHTMMKTRKRRNILYLISTMYYYGLCFILNIIIIFLILVIIISFIIY